MQHTFFWTYLKTLRVGRSDEASFPRDASGSHVVHHAGQFLDLHGSLQVIGCRIRRDRHRRIVHSCFRHFSFGVSINMSGTARFVTSSCLVLGSYHNWIPCEFRIACARRVNLSAFTVDAEWDRKVSCLFLFLDPMIHAREIVFIIEREVFNSHSWVWSRSIKQLISII